MSLSKRLSAIVEMVPEGCVLCDIGTDHAAVPIELVSSGKCPGAVASDIIEGPLKAARENIARAGLFKKIRVVLSDGFSALKTEDGYADGFDCAVICGMGGRTMLKILEEMPKRFCASGRCSVKTLVLSPQSEAENVRKYIRENGFFIEAEKLVYEDEKYYPIIRAARAEAARKNCESVPEESAAAARARDLYGPCLIRDKDAVLAKYLERRELILAEIERGIARAAKETADKKRAEIEEERKLIKTCREMAGWELKPLLE